MPNRTLSSHWPCSTSKRYSKFLWTPSGRRIL